jgi:predicted Fe-S protein YdhL (DUF1289 family)
VTQHLPTGYVFDPDDPRAPTHAQWEAMTAAERDRVVAMLPARVPIEAERLREELEQRAGALAVELAEERLTRAEADRTIEDERHRREEAERRLAEALAEIARLKKAPE